MKLFLLALACLASANGEVTCDECVASMGKLVDRLTGDESIQEQIGILLGNICPGAEDPAACEAGIGAAWPPSGPSSPTPPPSPMSPPSCRATPSVASTP